jgi:tetratricopeptide (TPR) repeat protein
MGERNKVASTLNRLKEELKPTHPRTWWKIGTVYRRNKFYKEAEDAHQKAIEIDPNYFWSHYALADIYKKQGRYEKALKKYKETLRTTDHEWYINNSRKNIIEIYEKTGKLDELAQELEKRLKDVEKGETK